MKELISRAITGHRLLRLIYNNRIRVTIEPYALGRTAAGDEVLLAWQISPPIAQDSAWRLFQLNWIAEMRMLDDGFDATRSDRTPPLEELELTFQSTQ